MPLCPVANVEHSGEIALSTVHQLANGCLAMCVTSDPAKNKDVQVESITQYLRHVEIAFTGIRSGASEALLVNTRKLFESVPNTGGVDVLFSGKDRMCVKLRRKDIKEKLLLYALLSVVLFFAVGVVIVFTVDRVACTLEAMGKDNEIIDYVSEMWKGPPNTSETTEEFISYDERVEL